MVRIDRAPPIADEDRIMDIRIERICFERDAIGLRGWNANDMTKTTCSAARLFRTRERRCPVSGSEPDQMACGDAEIDSPKRRSEREF